MMTHSYISDFRILDPKYKVSNKNSKDWLKFAYGRSLDQKTLLDENQLETWINKYTVDENQISDRYTDLEDFTRNSIEGNIIFKQTNSEELGLGLSDRMNFYNKVVNEKAENIFDDLQKAPHHLIHTTCTGYISPSPLQRLCSKKGWHKTEITHAYHMGCYASMPSLRLANALSPSGDVYLYNSELCTLHFSTKDFTPEQLIVQSLFADGHIRYKCTNQAPIHTTSLKVLVLSEARVPDSEDDMTWTPGDSNFNMSISRDVPLKLAMNIHEGLNTLFEKCNLNADEMMKNTIFAIHPGGPKILDQVSMLLELREDQIMESRHILRTRGNMSSATLPHIWNEILQGQLYKPGQKIVSLAFGPGLSLFGSIFEIN